MRDGRKASGLVGKDSRVNKYEEGEVETVSRAPDTRYSIRIFPNSACLYIDDILIPSRDVEGGSDGSLL